MTNVEPTDDFSDIAKPVTKAAPTDDFSDIAKPSPVASKTPYFSANPNNEGLYEMSSPNGAAKVPYSRVTEAKNSGYTLTGADSKRYESDQPSRFQRLTEPNSPNTNRPTKPDANTTNRQAAWNAMANATSIADTAVGNVLKRAARLGAGTVNLPFQVISIVKRLGSSDVATSEQAEKELWDLHPGSQMVNRVKEAISDWKQSKSLAAENALGDILGMYLTGKATEGVIEGAKKIPGVGKAGLETVTKTSPKETGDLVKNTKAANDKSVERTQDINARRAEVDTHRAAKVSENNVSAKDDAAEKTARQNKEHEENRAAQVKQHFDKTQSVKTANEIAQDAQDRKTALTRGVETLDPQINDALKATEKKVHAQMDANYNGVRSRISEVTRNVPQEEALSRGLILAPDDLVSDVHHAEANIKGSNESLRIFKDIANKYTEGSSPATFSELQGYDRELGRVLSSGNLPDDVFRATRELRDSIQGHMQKMADAAGVGEQNKSARTFARQYFDTFRDPSSPITKAMNATERGKTIKAFSGKDQTGIQQLAKYDPELARRINTIRGYQSEASGIRNSTSPPRPEPALAPKKTTPEPVVAKEKAIPEPRKPLEPRVKTISVEDVRNAKAAGLEHRVNVLRARGDWVAGSLAGYKLLADIYHGNMAEVPMNIFEGGAAIGGIEGIARLLENPKVVDLLTKPTARDLAKIPENMRSGLYPVIQQAIKQGVRVFPALVSLVSANIPLGPKSKKLQEISDGKRK